MGRYSVGLVGESNYQAAIGQLSPGDPVTIQHEPDNPHDPRAIRVADVTGSTIGYIPRGSWVGRALIDDGLAMSATVERVTGGTPGQRSRGVVLAVSTAGDAAPAATPPAARAAPPTAVPQPGAAAPAKPAKTTGGGKTVLKVTLGVLGAVIALAWLSDQGAGNRAGRTAAPAAKATPDAAAIKAAADRKSGFHCLSSWDGSHRQLVRALKLSLRDPDSFEHVETRITPANAKGEHLLTMQYRARNGFGGMNIGRLIATVKNSDCSVTIVSNSSS